MFFRKRLRNYIQRLNNARTALAPTKTLGNVASYRLWIIDPDGKEIFAGRSKSHNYR